MDALISSKLSFATAVTRPASAQVWVPAWIASPTPDRRDGAGGTSLSFEEQTIRQDIRLGCSARRLRICISNEFGTTPLRVGRATVRRVDSPGQEIPLCFDGCLEVVIPVGTAMLSDPVPLGVPAHSGVALNLYFPERTYPTVRRTALRIAQGMADVSDDVPMVYRQGVVSAVLAERAEAPRVIVAFGDSITEGADAGVGTEGDWPTVLGQRLHHACPDRFVVLNAGISGNKVLGPGRSPSALARLDRDVLSLPGVSDVILLEGINDIRDSAPPEDGPKRSADDVIHGYRQIIARLLEHGIRTIGATLTPFAGADRYEPQASQTRRALNAFIRNEAAFGAVIDFDAYIRDPDSPESIMARLSDDRLHPNSSGLKVMAESIDLTVLVD